MKIDGGRSIASFRGKFSSSPCRGRVRAAGRSPLASRRTPPAETAPPYAIAPGGDADELAAVACGSVRLETLASSAAEAVLIGRARMTED